MKLFIVESPAKCKKIAEYLGKGWKVVATMGHIRGLVEDLDSIGIDRGWKPRFHVLDGKSKAVTQIKEAASGASEVWLGSDDDREGEAIAWHVCQILGLSPELTPRAIFHEVTKPAIQAAVASSSRRLDMDKVNAQLGRSMLDLMVGFTVSPVLWVHIAYGLSAGRCQTPALRIVADRENEIADFSSRTTWVYEGSWSCSSAQIACTGTHVPKSKEDAETYLQKVKAGGKLLTVAEKSSTQHPPLPLITSSLQQEASSQLHINPKATMRSAQSLYEAGHITYMRTDNAEISDDAKTEITALIESNWGTEYCGSGSVQKKKKKAKDAAVVQGAHEAIRPTHIEVRELPSEEDWSEQDKKIYTLIWRRTVQSQMSPAQQKTRTFQFVATDDIPTNIWKGSASMLGFKGWKILNAETAAEEAFNATNTWKAGDNAAWTDLEARQVASQPPSRFNDAQLIAELETRGIGRPSTFASLITTLYDREYIEKKTSKGATVDLHKILRKTGASTTIKTELVKKEVGGDKEKIHITERGQSVMRILGEKFSDVFNYEFTSRMEEDLDQVAGAGKQYADVLQNLWTTIEDRVKPYMKGGEKRATAAIDTNSEKVLKDFGSGLIIMQTKKGPLLFQKIDGAEKGKFAAIPEGRTIDTLTTDEAIKAFKSQNGETIATLEGEPIIRKSGPYGEYLRWKTVNAKYIEGMSAEDAIAAFQPKVSSTGSEDAAFSRDIGGFTIKRGPYGLYFYKNSVQKKVFAKWPVKLDPMQVKAKDLADLYKQSLEEKKNKKPFITKKTKDAEA